ncbi:hypothetical protein [Amycolatopsis circi]|uniref:hypothetical protein n=1 Tax=Amycolatopsis circi TaxID=871959 RepID=UPI000E2883DD|nr:hypothetical protein [Amycolatopsis circi]
MLTDFLQYFRQDLREVWRTMPAADLAAFVRRLVRIPTSALADLLSDGEAAWGPHEENTARLLEAQDYALQLTWNDRTIDPDDPELRKERAIAKRNGFKPPPFPMIPPSALRPPKLAQARVDAYLAEVHRYQNPPKPEADVIPLDEWERAKGIVTEHQ